MSFQERDRYPFLRGGYNNESNELPYEEFDNSWTLDLSIDFNLGALFSRAGNPVKTRAYKDELVFITKDDVKIHIMKSTMKYYYFYKKNES